MLIHCIAQALCEVVKCFISFLAKKIAKFKDWLGIGTSIDIKASTAVIEIMSYLAYETVNEVRK